MGLSFIKRESKLQNEILIYKMGFLDYKWDSRVAIHQCDYKINCLNCHFVIEYSEGWWGIAIENMKILVEIETTKGIVAFGGF